jgi:hypothetical protein
MGMAGNLVRWDDIMDALRTLDREADGFGKPLPHYKRVLARKDASLPGANLAMAARSIDNSRYPMSGSAKEYEGLARDCVRLAGQAGGRYSRSMN